MYVWWTNREKVTTTKFAGHDKRLTAIENALSKIDTADSKASGALRLVEEVTKALTDFKLSLAKDMETMRLDFSQKSLCGNHQRMENNDEKLFNRLDSLHGDIRELCGGVKGLTNSLELVNQHLLNGGK